jgi:hypothetical protein
VTLLKMLPSASKMILVFAFVDFSCCICYGQFSSKVVMQFNVATVLHNFCGAYTAFFLNDVA